MPARVQGLKAICPLADAPRAFCWSAGGLGLAAILRSR